MSSKSDTDEVKKEKMSFADAMELMKDPKALAAAAAMHGFQLQVPGTTNKKDDDKEEQITPPGDIELDENATSKDVLAAMQKLMKQNNDYLLKHMEKSTKSYDKKLQSLKYEQQANEVNRFIKKHKVPQELLSDMDAFYRKGESLEDSYEKAKKLNGIKDEVSKDKEDKPSKSDEKPIRKSPRISEEAEGDKDGVEKVAPKSIGEAARNTMKDMIANDPDVSKILSGEPDI